MTLFSTKKKLQDTNNSVVIQTIYFVLSYQMNDLVGASPEKKSEKTPDFFERIEEKRRSTCKSVIEFKFQKKRVSMRLSGYKGGMIFL